jgi:hypothetical protein
VLVEVAEAEQRGCPRALRMVVDELAIHLVADEEDAAAAADLTELGELGA